MILVTISVLYIVNQSWSQFRQIKWRYLDSSHWIGNLGIDLFEWYIYGFLRKLRCHRREKTKNTRKVDVQRKLVDLIGVVPGLQLVMIIFYAWDHLTYDLLIPWRVFHDLQTKLRLDWSAKPWGWVMKIVSSKCTLWDELFIYRGLMFIPRKYSCAETRRRDEMSATGETAYRKYTHFFFWIHSETRLEVYSYRLALVLGFNFNFQPVDIMFCFGSDGGTNYHLLCSRRPSNS